jgi:hypothetical protein
MTSRTFSRAVRPAGVALLPAVVMLCCAGRASAGCGDYVRIVGPDGQVQSPVGHDPMPGERPCQGPNCSGGPKAPAPIPPAPTGPAPVVKGLVPHADRHGGLRTAGCLPPPADASPVRLPTSIFHPPRA